MFSIKSGSLKSNPVRLGVKEMPIPSTRVLAKDFYIDLRDILSSIEKKAFIKLINSTEVTVFLILKSLEENVVYFQTPSEIKVLSELKDIKIRVGGMVKKESILFAPSPLHVI